MTFASSKDPPGPSTIHHHDSRSPIPLGYFLLAGFPDCPIPLLPYSLIPKTPSRG
jgi:hypothetical protein